MAELTATRPDGAGVSVHTAFTLVTRSGSGAVELARLIQVTPVVSFDVNPGTTAGSATLQPATPLAPDTLYRFALRTADGSLAGSWVFQTGRAPQIAGTLPADGTTGVPVSSGIEITFDQDGVGDIASFFSISPRVDGRFERRGRTAVFVPAELKPLTLYTVTIRRGVPLPGSDLVLEETKTFRFETGPLPGRKPANEPEIWASIGPVEATTSEQPTMEFRPGPGVTAVSLRVYRLASIEAAIDAYVTLQSAPDWAGYSDAGLVRTADLTEVTRFTVQLHTAPRNSDAWVRFPKALPAGWYLVDVPRAGRDVQVVLQVTDVSASAIAASGRTLVWAHELTAHAALAGATVATASGTAMGSTDADGVMLATTPPAVLASDPLQDARAGILVVRAPDATTGDRTVVGRAVFVVLGGWSTDTPFEDRYWRLLYTDRSLFRPTDTIAAWGVLRARDGGATVGAELRLLAAESWGWVADDAVAITRVPIKPDPATGMFAIAVPIENLPLGSYVLASYVGEHRIASAMLQVGVIRKPAYELTAATDRHVVVVGDPLTTTVTASFFDGTSAPGIDVGVGKTGQYRDTAGTAPAGRATTGPDGAASVTLPATWGDYAVGQWDRRQVWARPTNPEEGEISASADVLVFLSSVVLDADAALAGTRLSVKGSLHAVDLARLEREELAGREGDVQPAGAPVAKTAVSAQVTEQWWVAVRTGQYYDFIAKKTVPTYDYDYRTKDLGTRRVVTGSDGAFSLALTVPSAGHGYTITLTAADAKGRRTTVSVSAEGEGSLRGSYGTNLPSLAFDRPDGGTWAEGTYAVGDEVRVRIVSPTGTMPSGGRSRYLFYVAQPGRFDLHLEESPVYTQQFGERDIPSVAIGAIWFDGSQSGVTHVDWGCGASLSTVEARLDPASRPITVDLTADAPRYRPGGRVSLSVRTTDGAGHPVSASVVLRAIDEKLYAIGGAMTPAVARDLYWWMPGEDGIASIASSHRVPAYNPNLGVTCGPGAFYRPGPDERDDFRDTLLFRLVRTDAGGHATVSFDLSDDITSWRVSASAVGGGLQVGEATIGIPVGLPLFVEAPVAPDYLVGEQPILRLRAYGDSLRAGDAVTFTVTAPSLGMQGRRVTGTAFTAVEVPLPALTAGGHRVSITAAAERAESQGSDTLVRTMHVVATRFTQRRTVFADLADGLPRAGGSGLVGYVFTDAGRARLVGPLEVLANVHGARVDQSLAAVVARDLLSSAFGVRASPGETPTFDVTRYQVALANAPSPDDEKGIALLPYASPDVMLSARVALLAADRFDVTALRGYLERLRLDESGSKTRETQDIALAGLAGLGDPVLPEIHEALTASDLTIRQRLYLALGAASLGDHTTALTVERNLLATYGQRLGPWLRLRVGESLDDTIEATALVALIGATVGDPAAEAAETYVEQNPAVDDLFNLQEVSYIARVLDRIPAAPARLSYTVDGTTRTADIAPGRQLALTLTPSQAGSLSARTVAGRIGVAVWWDEPVAPATLSTDPSLTLTRTVTPAGIVDSGRLMTVTLTATFGSQALRGCYAVVDILPSGLAPVDSSGQRMEFCMTPSSGGVTYRARVVTPGIYRWEPATIRSATASESLALTPVVQLVLR